MQYLRFTQKWTVLIVSYKNVYTVTVLTQQHVISSEQFIFACQAPGACAEYRSSEWKQQKTSSVCTIKLVNSQCFTHESLIALLWQHSCYQLEKNVMFTSPEDCPHCQWCLSEKMQRHTKLQVLFSYNSLIKCQFTIKKNQANKYCWIRWGWMVSIETDREQRFQV